MSKIMDVFFEDNQTFQEGGGFTSKLLPKRLTKAGIFAGMGIGVGVGVGKEMFKMHNRLKAGPTTYQGGPVRMTDNFDSGAVEAISNVTKDPKIQQEMIKNMLKDKYSIRPRFKAMCHVITCAGNIVTSTRYRFLNVPAILNEFCSLLVRSLP